LFEVPVKDIALSELQQMKVDFKLEIWSDISYALNLWIG
jgi:hypothetical protein